MSTKTAFKRIALVAAAALAIGGVSAVSANASAAAVSDSFTAAGAATVSTTSTASVASTAALTYSAVDTTALGGDTATLAGTVVSSPITSAASAVTFATTVGATQVNNVLPTSTVVATAVGRFTAYVTASFTPDVSGTYIIKLTSVGAINNAYVTWTVTVAAKAAITAASSTLTPSATTLSAFKTAALPAGSVGIIASNGITAPAAGSADAAILSATVSGPGLISFTNSFAASGRVASQAAANSGTLYIFADGTAGTGTITISSGTTVLGTQVVTFYGTAASIVVTVIKSVLASSATLISNTTTSDAGAITVTEKDVNGFALPASAFGTLTVTSDAAASVVSGTLAGQDLATLDGFSTTLAGYALVPGATAGAANLTVTDSGLTGVVSNSVSVRTSAAVPTIVTFSTDAAMYTTGGVGTLTVTLADLTGSVPAGTYYVLTGQASASLALVTGTLPGAADAAAVPALIAGDIVVGNAGTKTVTFNAPLSDGTATITGTAAATTITITPATFTVASGSSDAANAATDAANEATDAANAATDAANAAADSADAATQAAQDAGDKASAALAAVTALSQQVTTLLAKVAALSVTLAKITKAIAALPKK